MGITIGRLQKFGVAKRGTTLPTVPLTAGTFLQPTQMIRFTPPLDWDQTINVLPSEAISGVRELPTKAVKGSAELKGKKIVGEVEPSDWLGMQLQAAFGQDSVSGNGTSSAHAHNFQSVDSAALPTYDFWLTKTNKQFGFGAMMMAKFDLNYNKGERLKIETEWDGLYYVDGLSVSPTASFPSTQPGTWAQCQAWFAGSQVLNVSQAHISIVNHTVAEHFLRDDTNQASMVWSEGQEVNFDAEFLFEDTTEYNKFLNVSSDSQLSGSSFRLLFTSADKYTEGSLNEAYKLDIVLPSTFYKKAAITLPTGVVKVKVEGGTLPAITTIGSGGNAYLLTTARLAVAQYINGSSTQY